jgi:hypothetical protein
VTHITGVRTFAFRPDLNESMERAAGLTARILGGAGPADLPLKEPTHLHLRICPAGGYFRSSRLELARSHRVKLIAALPVIGAFFAGMLATAFILVALG